MAGKCVREGFCHSYMIVSKDTLKTDVLNRNIVPKIEGKDIFATENLKDLSKVEQEKKLYVATKVIEI